MTYKVAKRAILSAIAICIISSVSFSQNHVPIKGIVLNAENNDPIPFATVAFSDRSFGVITNDDGSFSLPIAVNNSLRQIEVSCIGFQSKLVSVGSFSDDKIQTIKLTPISYDIDEAEVRTKKRRGASAAEIVSNAVKSINTNYPNFPFLLSGYYRDYLKIDDKYINLYEAVVKLQDNGFNTNEDEQTRIGLSYGALNKSFTIDYNMVTNYGNHKVVPYGSTEYKGGNEFYFLLAHNPIRNYLNESFSFIKRLQIEFLDDHRFEVIGTEYIDNILCYKIAINYTKSEHPAFAAGSISNKFDFKNNYKAVGHIYIQADNYRIHKLSYLVTFKKIRLWELNVSYKDVDGAFYLNYLSFNNLVETLNYIDEGYFHLQKIAVDKERKQVKLLFNNPVDSLSALKIRSYRLRFDGNRLKVNSVSVSGKYLTISIDDFDRMLGSFEQEHMDRLDFADRNLRDTYGNKINDLKTTRAYQYREFFVNDASTEFESIPNNQLLDKIKPMLFKNNTIKTLPDSVIFNSPLIGGN